MDNESKIERYQRIARRAYLVSIIGFSISLVCWLLVLILVFWE